MLDDRSQGESAVSRDRLRDSKAGLFTSDLTVNEYLLVDDAGFEPLGLVVGSSIYHIGYQRRRLSTSHELTVVSEAIYHARELAMERMTAEAEELDADGVVGVRLEVKGVERARHVAEFLAVGTAIRQHLSWTSATTPDVSYLPHPGHRNTRRSRGWAGLACGRGPVVTARFAAGAAQVSVTRGA
ncbi:MAG: heavy metal-binding domain-containing protein [Solirubrobacteraceae bacterium]|jgi:uncharacterized protein YbjQ (UPF0145 family)